MKDAARAGDSNCLLYSRFRYLVLKLWVYLGAEASPQHGGQAFLWPMSSFLRVSWTIGLAMDALLWVLPQSVVYTVSVPAIV